MLYTEIKDVIKRRKEAKEGVLIYNPYNSKRFLVFKAKKGEDFNDKIFITPDAYKNIQLDGVRCLGLEKEMFSVHVNELEILHPSYNVTTSYELEDKSIIIGFSKDDIDMATQNEVIISTHYLEGAYIAVIKIP